MSRRVNTRGRHRARTAPRRSVGVKAAVSAVGVAGVAVAGAAVIGVAPTLSVSPQLMATLHYLRGTNIGNEPTDGQYEDFIGRVLAGSDTAEPDAPYEKVPYNAGFKPFSHGGFADLTYNASVQQGVNLLAGQNPGDGDLIFGFSQGAVAASKYKETHTGNTYVLVENPSRPNGGVMERFKGWTIPFVDVTFSGATPNNGDPTIDVARQYDGWADFPAYLWNPVAVANAFMGIVLVHGNTQTQLTAADLEAAEASGDSDYYQYNADSNTKYYLIKTYPVPLLMPLESFLPASVIAALDAPLRAFIETAYDRTDYGTPKPATLFKPFGQVDTLATTLVADDAVAAKAAAEPVDRGRPASETPDIPIDGDEPEDRTPPNPEASQTITDEDDGDDGVLDEASLGADEAAASAENDDDTNRETVTAGDDESAQQGGDTTGTTGSTDDAGNDGDNDGDAGNENAA